MEEEENLVKLWIWIWQNIFLGKIFRYEPVFWCSWRRHVRRCSSSGYLKLDRYKADARTGKRQYYLKITNHETMLMFEDMVESWFAGEESAYGILKMHYCLGIWNTWLCYVFHKRTKVMTFLYALENIVILFQLDNVTDLVIAIFKRIDFTRFCYAHKMCQWHQLPKSSDSLCRTYLIAVQCQFILTLAEKYFNRPSAYVIRQNRIRW